MNAPAAQTQGWTLAQWRQAYREGASPDALLAAFTAGVGQDNAWIAGLDTAGLAAQLAALARRLNNAGGDLERLPLYGVPFAIKDNIDAQGWATTAACPPFAYRPDADATVVARLRAAGAILVGKTNLDQFATGLVGTRSPHGAVSNSFDARYISGGSSSGSASVVARGLVPFSLGTDTAGSGRVPAGFNNIVGLKPTRGWLSTAGVVPACRTLDCVSVFALTVEDALAVADIAGGYDGADAYSRAEPPGARLSWQAPPRLAVPAQCEFFGDEAARKVYEDALARLRALGAQIDTIDFAPFEALAELLYQGPWVAERFAAVQSIWREQPEALHPVVRGIVEQAQGFSATDAFMAEYRRAALARRIQDTLAGFDALVVPTSPSIYTIAQLQADPVTLNSRLGRYTNFANLADLSALAVPAGMRDDGLPAGITFIGLAWQDHGLAAFGQRWQRALDLPLGATGKPLPPAADLPASGDTVRVAVVGAHLTGMPLNHQLISRQAKLAEQTRTADSYRLYALANTTPPKPGLVRTEEGGAGIEVELWDVPSVHFGSFVAEIPAPLGIGTLELADGRRVKGFICEPCALQNARDITSFGGWRAFIAARP
ncbi:allophanate hydrolase [Bordetella genomosp. 12]|uniref:Allophanate hydrolase n=1 Tax=Bordetella genomosp. 12 TaxID=463035 RepID=A0A261VCB1_9BORD|nr:allophanate hydrolase [Bordetella genomosp. 12]OZI71210.1 allophanate hydrolase [Bordetella genomosp. 12]